MFEEEVEVTLAETGSPFHSSQVRSLLIFKHLVLESFHNPTICTGCKRTKTNQCNALSTFSAVGFPAGLPTHLHIFWPNTHLRLVQQANIVRTLRMMVLSRQDPPDNEGPGGSIALPRGLTLMLHKFQSWGKSFLDFYAKTFL